MFSRAYVVSPETLTSLVEQGDFRALEKLCREILKDDLGTKSRDHLLFLAARASVPNYTRLTKEKLIEAIRRSRDKSSG
jgi:hypothetical protein